MSPPKTDELHAWLAGVYEGAGDVLWKITQANERVMEKAKHEGVETGYVEDRYRKANAACRLVVRSAEQAYNMGSISLIINEMMQAQPGVPFEELEIDNPDERQPPIEVVEARLRWETTLRALQGEGADA